MPKVSLFWQDMFIVEVIFAAFLLLNGCSDEYARLQAQAEWQAKVARAAIPHDGELVTIRKLGDSYTVRRYKGGLIRTDVIARESE